MFKCIEIKEEYGMLRVIFIMRNNTISITHSFLTELNQIMDLALARDDIKTITLEGSSGIFCTGMDFHEASSGQADNLFYQTLNRFTRIPKYIISKVDGKAIGGGVGITAASDIVLASPRAEFSLAEAIWGLLPCMVMPFLMRRTGFQTAYRMAISTIPAGCTEAYRNKLVDYESDNLDAECRKIQRRLQRVSCDAIGEAKSYCQKIFSDRGQNAEQLSVEEFAKLIQSEKVQENIFNYITDNKFPWDK